MARAARIPPTRINLLRTRQRIERLEKAVAVLRRRREALVAELFRSARPAAEARRMILQQAQRAYPALLRALGRHGAANLEALAWPTGELEVEMASGVVWGVVVSRMSSRIPVIRHLSARGIAPPFTESAIYEAAREFEKLVELLLDSGAREMLIRRLGAAVAEVSLRMNALEKRVAPLLEAQARSVRGALEEREREERLRFKHLLRVRTGAAPYDRAHTGHSSPRQHISQNNHS